jgi:hypothetical protein
MKHKYYRYGMGLLTRYLFMILICLPFLAGTSSAEEGLQKEMPEDESIKIEKKLEKQYLNLFRKLFFSRSYDSLKCHENIYRLLKKAEEKKLDPADLSVIFIFNKEHDQLMPIKSQNAAAYGVHRPTITMHRTRIVHNRSDPPGQFRYHVFAAIRDKIMDFDYTNSPKQIPVQEYFKNMFSPKKMSGVKRRELFDNLSLRIISATEYLQTYPQHTSWYLFDLEQRFPSRSANDYIREISGMQKKK